MSPILPLERAFFLDYVDKKDPIYSLIEPDVLQFQHDRVGNEQMVFTEGFHSFVRVMPRHWCSDHPETTSMIAKINNTLQIFCVKKRKVYTAPLGRNIWNSLLAICPTSVKNSATIYMYVQAYKVQVEEYFSETITIKIYLKKESTLQLLVIWPTSGTNPATIYMQVQARKVQVEG